MYIFKNAIRCIGGGKGRNILIGIIAVSDCIGLSIRQAAESAKATLMVKPKTKFWEFFAALPTKANE